MIFEYYPERRNWAGLGATLIGREKGEAAVFWVGFTGTGTGKETKETKVGAMEARWKHWS